MGSSNIKSIPKKNKVVAGNTYYWRVDAIDGQDRVVKGDVWVFTAV